MGDFIPMVISTKTDFKKKKKKIHMDKFFSQLQPPAAVSQRALNMHSAALLIKTRLVRHALKWESVGAWLSDTYCQMCTTVCLAHF